MLALALGTSACGPERTEGTLLLEAHVRPAGDALDVLFVVDDSNGMSYMQLVLSDYFAVLSSRLLDPPSGESFVADMHVGVIDANLGAGGFDVDSCGDPSFGALQHQGMHDGCPAAFEPPYLTHRLDAPNDGGPGDPNGLDLVDEFGCIVNLGDHGCGLEQPLGSLRLALDDRVEDGTNAGFLRPGAALAVVIVTEEDDCTTLDPSFYDPEREDLAELQLRCAVHPAELEPVADTVELLRVQRPEGRVALGAWIGVPLAWDGTLDGLELDPAIDWRTARYSDFELCENSRGIHYKAPRLAELVLRMGVDGFAWSQCEGDDMLDDFETLAALIADHLDPTACLPSAPPEGSRCEASLHLLEPGERCPAGTAPTEPRGTCTLREDQWQIVGAAGCTELRPGRGLDVPLGASLELRCYGPPSDSDE